MLLLLVSICQTMARRNDGIRLAGKFFVLRWTSASTFRTTSKRKDQRFLPDQIARSSIGKSICILCSINRIDCQHQVRTTKTRTTMTMIMMMMMMMIIIITIPDSSLCPSIIVILPRPAARRAMWQIPLNSIANRIQLSMRSMRIGRQTFVLLDRRERAVITDRFRQTRLQRAGVRR